MLLNQCLMLMLMFLFMVICMFLFVLMFRFMVGRAGARATPALLAIRKELMLLLCRISI